VHFFLFPFLNRKRKKRERREKETREKVCSVEDTGNSSPIMIENRREEKPGPAKGGRKGELAPRAGRGGNERHVICGCGREEKLFLPFERKKGGGQGVRGGSS